MQTRSLVWKQPILDEHKKLKWQKQTDTGKCTDKEQEPEEESARDANQGDTVIWHLACV